MALAHCGIHRSQSDLALALGMVADFGVPASNIMRLRTQEISVGHVIEANIMDVQGWLEQDAAVIAYLQTRFLSYWQGHQTQHAVLVIGLDERNVHLLDPAQDETPIAAPIEEFLLAWDEMAFTMSIIRRN